MTGSAPTAEQPLRIGRYEVEAKLGEGGMAHTWLCRLPGARGFSKHVVVKTLKQGSRSRQDIAMFTDEARIGVLLDHPNIPKILEFGEAGGRPYLVQEFVDGPTLLQILERQTDRGHFDAALGCHLAAEVAGALHAAWTATDPSGQRLNVIHRDVSPSNVLVSRQGIVKLIDFGVARFEHREAGTELGYVKGKVRYMAPEVLRSGKVSHRSDLYALGVCAYALCTGEPLRHIDDDSADVQYLLGIVHRLDDTDEGLQLAHELWDAVPALSRHRGLDPQLGAILQGCLQADPEARYANGLVLKQAFEGWLDKNGGRLGPQEVSARIAELFPGGYADWRGDVLTMALMRSEIGAVPRSREPPRRRRWGPVLTGLLASVLVAGLVAVAVVTSGSLASAFWIWRANVSSSAGSHVDAVLDSVEAEIQTGRLEEARNTLSSLPPPDDAAEAARYDALATQLTAARIARIRDLAILDPAAARVGAAELAADRPGDAAVAALLESLAGR